MPSKSRTHLSNMRSDTASTQAIPQTPTKRTKLYSTSSSARGQTTQADKQPVGTLTLLDPMVVHPGTAHRHTEVTIHHTVLTHRTIIPTTPTHTPTATTTISLATAIHPTASRTAHRSSSRPSVLGVASSGAGMIEDARKQRSVVAMSTRTESNVLALRTTPLSAAETAERTPTTAKRSVPTRRSSTVERVRTNTPRDCVALMHRCYFFSRRRTDRFCRSAVFAGSMTKPCS